MKLSAGLTKIIPSIFVFVSYGLCVAFLTLCIKKLEVSVAYSVWAGLGTTLIAVIGMIWFQESATPIKLISISFIIVGVIGLNSGK